MDYTYKQAKITSLPVFLRNNGSNFVLFWYDDMGEDTLEIVDRTHDAMVNLFNKYKNKNAYLGNIDTNTFLDMKEYLIPYKQQPPPAPPPAPHITKTLYYIDFVIFSFKDYKLEIKKEESGSKVHVTYDSESECLKKTNLKNFGSHVVIRSNTNREVFEPLYDVKRKKFYYSGSRLICPFSIFE